MSLFSSTLKTKRNNIEIEILWYAANCQSSHKHARIIPRDYHYADAFYFSLLPGQKKIINMSFAHHYYFNTERL